jgi:hypothetical protein
MGYLEILKLKGMGHLYPNRKAAEKEVKVAPPKMPKEPNKRSATQKHIIAELKRLYPLFLATRKRCEIQGPNCTGKATCAHHTEGRLPSVVLDTTKWKASCSACNLWCETHHADAAKKGMKKSKFKK